MSHRPHYDDDDDDDGLFIFRMNNKVLSSERSIQRVNLGPQSQSDLRLVQCPSLEL